MSSRGGVLCFVFLVVAAPCAAGSFDLTGTRGGNQVMFMVQLEDPPAVEAYAEALGGPPARASAKALADATSAAKNQLARIENAQLSVVAQLEAGLDAEVLFRVQRVYNGVAIRVDKERVAEIAALPGVRAVIPMAPPRLANATSVPHIGAVEAWIHDPPATGAGVSVGIIDSGIDYIHTDFGGSGEGADYLSNDQSTVDDGFFPTAKVVGGWDFLDDDPDPYDPPAGGLGHGTHVAGTVAGYGLNEDGSTYTGPYDETTLFDELGGGPGVAPDAVLHGLRVFDNLDGGVSAVQAIEWAVDPDGDGDFSDHLDVINMSFGCSLYGNAFGGGCDPACDNAALAGVIPVGAAGNSADGFYITLSPGTANRSISVAASSDTTKVYSAVNIDAPQAIAGEIVGRYQGFAGSFATEVSAEVVETAPSDACSALSNADEIVGRIALVSWTGCALGAKAKLIEASGGLGVIVVPDGWPEMPLDAPSQQEVDIPVVMVREHDGQRIRAALPGVEVRLGFFPVRFDGRDNIADFSSRGPRYPDSMLKPDVAAPGTTIRSASAGTGTAFAAAGGTSMATPHVVGAMAVLRELHPTWSVEELKALLMNTAVDTFLGPGGVPPFNALSRVGAGRIDLARAVEAETVAFATEPAGYVSASFGLVEVSGRVELSRTIRVVNFGEQEMTFGLAYESRAGLPGVGVILPELASVTVAAGDSFEFELQLIAESEKMNHVCDPEAGDYVPVKSPDPSVPLPGGPGAMARPCPSEVAGYIELAPGSTDHPTLRVPVHAVLRAVAAMGSEDASLPAPGLGAGLDLVLTGEHLDPSTMGVQQASKCSAYELAEVSPVELGIDDKSYDLRYVGVSSDLQPRKKTGQGLDNTVISFAVVTHGPRVHPNLVGLRVWVDTDQDGGWDHVVTNYPTIHWDSSAEDRWVYWSDVSWSLVQNLDSGAMQWQYPVNGVLPDEVDLPGFGTEAMVLLANARDLGLVEGASAFAYRVDTIVPVFEVFRDSSAVHTYDPAQPGLHVAGTATAPTYLDDLDGAVIPLEYDRTAYLANDSQGLLLIHHHNASGQQAEVVEIVPGWTDPPETLPEDLD